MNGKLILSLSLLGVIMSFVTLYIPTIAETLCWLLIIIFSAWQISKKAPKKPFLNGFMVSVANIAWVTAVRICMITVYMAHHTKEAAHYEKVNREVNLSPVMVMLVMAPFIATFYGLILGLFSTIATGLASDR